MFPVFEGTINLLLLLGVSLSAALSVQASQYLRAFYICLATAIFGVLTWYQWPTGEYAGLGLIFLIFSFLSAASIGAGLGVALHFSKVRKSLSGCFLWTTAALTSGYLLWLQYIPEDCFGEPFPARIAGEALSIPAEMRPYIEAAEVSGYFGRLDRKQEFAGFCRSTENGTLEMDIQMFRITPASAHTTMTAACSHEVAPDWCSVYSSEPFRYIREIQVIPQEQLSTNFPYWNESIQTDIDQRGDLLLGSVCVSPEWFTRTACWAWQPFGDGWSILVATNNVDRFFDSVSTDEAREMVRQVTEMALSIMYDQRL